jgi:hypothetical protein
MDGSKLNYSVKTGRERRHVLGCASAAARDPENERREHEGDDGRDGMVVHELIEAIDAYQQGKRVTS